MKWVGNLHFIVPEEVYMHVKAHTLNKTLLVLKMNKTLLVLNILCIFSAFIPGISPLPPAVSCYYHYLFSKPRKRTAVVKQTPRAR